MAKNNHRAGTFKGLVLLCLILVAGKSAAGDRALLIGIGDYRIEAATLPGVAEDLTMMREVVRTLGFSDSQVKVLADSEATLEGIRDAISDWLVAGTTAGDRAFFYHSGHGSRVFDASGDEADGSDEALLPFDFVELPAGGDRKQLRNVLLDDELGRLLALIPADEVVALVDACHSGTMTRSLGRWRSKFYGYPGMPPGDDGVADFEPGTRSLLRRDSIVLLAAAGPAEEAQTSKRGALFTQGVWQAVRDAEPRQQLTLEQLKSATERYIRQEVGRRTDLIHRPMLTGHQGLRSINLFLPAVEARVAVDTDPRPQATPARGLWGQLEALVRDAGQALQVTTSKSVYGVGESLELTVTAADEGYLYILNVGDGEDEVVVLYPNRYQAEHRVRRGQTVQIPAPQTRAIPSETQASFRLPAQLPSGRLRQENLVVAVQTAKPLFPAGATPASGDPQALFRVLRRGELTRSIGRGPLAQSAYSAGRVVVTIGAPESNPSD